MLISKILLNLYLVMMPFRVSITFFFLISRAVAIITGQLMSLTAVHYLGFSAKLIPKKEIYMQNA